MEKMPHQDVSSILWLSSELVATTVGLLTAVTLQQVFLFVPSGWLQNSRYHSRI